MKFEVVVFLLKEFVARRSLKAPYIVSVFVDSGTHGRLRLPNVVIFAAKKAFH